MPNRPCPKLGASKPRALSIQRAVGFRGEGFRGEGFRGLGFRGEGLRGLGFRGLGFRGEGLRGLGFRGFGFMNSIGRGLAFRVMNGLYRDSDGDSGVDGTFPKTEGPQYIPQNILLWGPRKGTPNFGKPPQLPGSG